jgi:hypothetical protein
VNSPLPPALNIIALASLLTAAAIMIALRFACARRSKPTCGFRRWCRRMTLCAQRLRRSDYCPGLPLAKFDYCAKMQQGPVGPPNPVRVVL